jgi:S-DNA-T family DNA segregation ATPase FtsK/SpoIIIE
MAKKNRKSKKDNSLEKRGINFWLPPESKRSIAGLLMILVALIISLSFFERSGLAGETLKKWLLFLVGKTVFVIPLFFLLSGLISFRPKYKNFFYPLFLANFILILGISGILEGLNPGKFSGGWLGYLAAWPLLKLFDFLVTQVIFIVVIVAGILVFLQLIPPLKISGRSEENLLKTEVEKIEVAKEKETGSLMGNLLKKVSLKSPSFKVKEISSPESEIKSSSEPPKIVPELKTKTIGLNTIDYSPPPTDLLEKDGGRASPGDVKQAASIIKKTLQNFEIPVEMCDVNVGPTVTQYTLKPAEGIKLSKITVLSNDLALALASHPIRIEAPIPGKSLVGIEVPNKLRVRVGLREMIESKEFQNSPPLTIVLGKDVSGSPVFADLAKMPHLLVAGSTGSGKTVQLNSLILSLIYKNSPEFLRFILIDPKRVEFSAYAGLPHLLAPVIFDASQTINALRWLIGEMERRFDKLAEVKARDIISFNSKAEKGEHLPYIVLIIDELADLMAAKGKEMEAGIVRLAQMARAVGIHLVVATQRPSVEVITGLIKANITCRITFQVASQVDSRTIIDTAGAEKLLGAGDLLYLSPELGKPKRVQSAFVSEKEVKRVVNYLKEQEEKYQEKGKVLSLLENDLALDLKKTIEEPQPNLLSLQGSDFSEGEDPLLEQAKKEVILAKKASASLLQRRLRIGYARAARLLDILEEKGVVGPAEGAKPRKVYLVDDQKQDDGWQKV